VTDGAIVRIFLLELSVVVVLVTIRTTFVRNQESCGKLRSQRGFVTLFAFYRLVFPLQSVVCERVVKPLNDERAPRSGSMTRLALFDFESGIVGRFVTRRAIVEAQRYERHNAVLLVVHLRVTLFARYFCVLSHQRKLCARVIERYDDGPS
jgi:hypothetical protein